MFDHITVTIQMRPSDSHANALAFYFLSNRRHRDDDGADLGLCRGEVDFLKEIRAVSGACDEEKMEEAIEGQEQREERSKMYSFFRQMKFMGMRPTNQQQPDNNRTLRE